MIERICQKCGKVFIPAPMHRYTEGGRMYCSWTCYNHRNDGGKPGKRKYKYVEVYDMHGELLRRFASANDAAEYTGFSSREFKMLAATVKHTTALCGNTKSKAVLHDSGTVFGSNKKARCYDKK